MSRIRTESDGDPSTLGGFLGVQVRKRGWSLNNVSEYTGMSPSYASKVFSGKIDEPSGRFTIYLAKALGLSADELYPYCLPKEIQGVSKRLDQLSEKLPDNMVQALRRTFPQDLKEARFYLRLLDNLEKVT